VYDVYFGTSPDPPLFAQNLPLGPSRTSGDNQSFALPTLIPGTTYYWKITSKTMAHLSRSTPVQTFTTAGSSPPPPSGAATIVLWPSSLPAAALRGDWVRAADSTAAGGFGLQNANRGRAKIVPAMADPVTYFEVTFSASAGTAYHVWIRGKSDGNSTANDSVHIQFSGAVDAAGAPLARIGTTASLEPVLQDGAGAPAPRGWGWTENGWGSNGPHVYFATTGSHTLRVQQREDGITIDQIVISPDAYLTAAPGARRDDATILAATP
jgi:hypothetical protein